SCADSGLCSRFRSGTRCRVLRGASSKTCRVSNRAAQVCRATPFHSHARLATSLATASRHARRQQQAVKSSRFYERCSLSRYAIYFRTNSRLLPELERAFSRALPGHAAHSPPSGAESKFAQRLSALLRDAKNFH